MIEAGKCWDELVDLVPIEFCSDLTSARAADVIQKYIDRAVNQALKETEVQTHNLKCWPDSFEALYSGSKRHEFRINDRDYRVSDELVQQEWEPGEGSYTGRSLRVKVLYIDYGPNWEIPAGYCVMSTSEPYDKRG